MSILKCLIKIICTHNSLVGHLQRELDFDDVRVRKQHLHNGLSEAAHVALPDLGIWTLQLAHHVEALRQLRKHVHHRVTEKRMFAALCKL